MKKEKERADFPYVTLLILSICSVLVIIFFFFGMGPITEPIVIILLGSLIILFLWKFVRRIHIKRQEKGKKEIFPWYKVAAIGLGILFVVMMIFSAMGTSWIQAFRTVKANDTVVIDYTLRDADGQPVITTDQNLYQTALYRGRVVFLTEPRAIKAGLIGNEPIIPVSAENYYLRSLTSRSRFAIFGQELDEMDAGVLGMKAGDTQTVRFTFPDPLIITMTRAEFDTIGGNFSLAEIGTVLPVGFSEVPLVEGIEGAESESGDTSFRIATVINKTGSSIQVQHRYPSVDITVREFGV